MKLRKLFGSLAAVLLIAAYAMPVGAEFKADKSKLSTDSSAPALSFDSDEWSDYVKKTRDADKIALDVSTETTKSYQGISLKLSGNISYNMPKELTYSKYLTDSEGKKLYPDIGSPGERALTMGIELSAESFGLEYFDNCLISFKYRIGEELENKLLNDSIFVYPTNDYYKVIVEKPLQLKYDKLQNNNVTQYSQGLMTVAPNLKATKIVFEIPVIKAVEATDFLYLDNISIETPLQEGGKTLCVANVDGYNANAEAQDIADEIVIQGEDNALSEAVNNSNESDKTNPVIYVSIAIIGIVVVAGIAIFVIKLKQRFY